MYREFRLNGKVRIVLRNFRICARGIIRTFHARQVERQKVQVDIEGL